jgi:Tfp pilus assembly protein PilF
VHENARTAPADKALLAEKLQQAGYRTSAFVSAFVLARRFGLGRGFDEYDDAFPAGTSERRAAQVTDAALADLAQASDKPRFMWVHYYDPHFPYDPPEPFRSEYAARPYLGEVASMDQQLGRLVDGFRQGVKGDAAIVVVGDHGEGLGEHGERQHGILIYNSTMRVPLVIAGPGVSAATNDTPVSARRVFHTILDWAGLGAEHSLRSAVREPVLGEAMKPFLEYGWQPQVMTVDGRYKAIEAGRLETYDVVADPGEARNLGAGTNLAPDARAALDEYPVPSPDAARTPDTLDPEAKQRLAALGYIGATSAPVIRPDAPRPADMAALFEPMERASGLFAAGDYAAAIPLLQAIAARDPYNLDAILRLATAYSSLGQNARAEATFKRAAAIAPRSPDVRTYLALHYARGAEWQKAVPLLEQVVAETPDKLPALEALARLRERQNRIAEAVMLRQKIYALRPPTPPELLQLGDMAMALGNTPAAIEAFERARTQQGGAFTHDLELGVLYLSARRLDDARAALDRVPPSHPGYPMALFKRAQVSVLMNEPDKAARIQLARQKANAETRELIERERMFR